MAGRDWRDKMIADILSLPEDAEMQRPFRVTMLEPAAELVEQAAEARNLQVPTFLRRAGFAVAAHDLGISVRELTQLDPRINRKNLVFRDPAGGRFGNWEIVRMRRPK